MVEVLDFQSFNFGFDLNLAEVPDFHSFDFGLNASIGVEFLNEMVCKSCISSLDSKFHDNDDKYSKNLS